MTLLYQSYIFQLHFHVSKKYIMSARNILIGIYTFKFQSILMIFILVFLKKFQVFIHSPIPYSKGRMSLKVNFFQWSKAEFRIFLLRDWLYKIKEFFLSDYLPITGGWMDSHAFLKNLSLKWNLTRISTLFTDSNYYHE